MAQKPNIPATLLWEYDLTTFNFTTSYKIVIERILERGNLHDWREMKACYTVEQIKETIEWSSQLDKRNKEFCRFFIKSDLLLPE